MNDLIFTDNTFVNEKVLVINSSGEIGKNSINEILDSIAPAIVKLDATTGKIPTSLLPPTSNSGGAVTTVNTRIGDVVINKTDVGLANVDNTTDVNKPISTAQATVNTSNTTTIATKQDKTSFAIPSIIAGTSSTSQKLLITDQSSTATNSINIDDLFSGTIAKNSTGRIIIPSAGLLFKQTAPANTSVQFDNIKIQVTSSGTGFEIGSVTGTMNVTLNAATNYGNGGLFASQNPNYAMTTTFASPFGWGSQNDGDYITLAIRDNANTDFYFIEIIIGTGFANNLIIFTKK